jgi:TonB family protein
MACCGTLAFGLYASAQQTGLDAVPHENPPAQVQQAPAAAQAEPSSAGALTEEALKQLLVGKPLYLRGGYLDNTLSFTEHGTLIGHSPQGSYTLSAIQIDKVHLTKHKVELTGARYGLHFLGALPYEDPAKAVDRVKITPKKKVLRITIDRELVVTPKKKDKENGKAAQADAWARKGPSADSTLQPATQPELSEAGQTKAEIAAAPAAERPADPGSVTRTTSPAHAARMLKDALDLIFAQGFDERLMASMPEFWKLYYQAAAAKTDYRPKDPAVLRQNTVDKKARLTSTFEPESNEYAQANGVAGMALYHTVIGADGKPGEIAVGRPIGFGLDENAVEAIRKASFEPAVKDGKPVPVLLDLVVQFRIYSQRTAAKPAEAAPPAGAVLPGPYSVQHPY